MIMIHLLPKADEFGEVFFFGKTEAETRQDPTFIEFLVDYKVQAIFSIELISGAELLPSYIAK